MRQKSTKLKPTLTAPAATVQLDVGHVQCRVGNSLKSVAFAATSIQSLSYTAWRLRICRGVSAWYEWLLKRGDKGPKYEGNTEPALFRNGMGVLDRRVMLDRANHVRNCSSCTKVGYPVLQWSL